MKKRENSVKILALTDIPKATIEKIIPETNPIFKLTGVTYTDEQRKTSSSVTRIKKKLSKTYTTPAITRDVNKSITNYRKTDTKSVKTIKSMN